MGNVRIPYYQIDAFANSVFSGNPAGVCLLEQWIEDDVLQSIAAENNHSETAFVVPGDEDYQIRWFTPKAEVDLCGHATLASAFVLFESGQASRTEVCFASKSGALTVRREADLLVMDFPARKAVACATMPGALVKGLGVRPSEVLLSTRDFLAVLADEQDVRELEPDMTELAKMAEVGVIVTARGSQSDFVSRFFAPQLGVPEDPVTGSAHTTLVPYWAERLGKAKLHALQLSERGGELFCEDRGDRVDIAGRAVAYLEGTIILG